MSVSAVRSVSAFLCLCAVLGAALASPAAAQTVWTRPYQNNQLSVEVVTPAFKDDAIEWTSGAAYLSGTYSLNENVELIGELPVARIDSGGVTESVIGNPYVGVGLSGTRTPFLLELGARLPLLEDPGPAAVAGSFTEVARTRAFQPEETVLSALANWRFEIDRATSLRVRAGGVYAEFPNVVDGRQRTERDVRLAYNAQLWYEGNRTILGLTFAGKGTLTTPGSYGQKSRHWFAGTVIGNFSTVRPGLLVGVSTDAEVRDVAALFFGLTLSTTYGD